MPVLEEVQMESEALQLLGPGIGGVSVRGKFIEKKDESEEKGKREEDVIEKKGKEKSINKKKDAGHEGDERKPDL